MKVDREAIQRAILPVLARDELKAFCLLMDSKYEVARHADLLIEHLEALERRDIQKLMVFMPPRVGKSYHVSERFPAWYLGKHPDHNVIVASHSERLAARASRRIRGLIGATEYPFDTEVNRNLRAADRWETTQQGGVLAAGVGTNIIGFGFELGVVDDPIGAREDAESEGKRNSVWEWYNDDFGSRRAPRAIELMMHQRWHEDDLAGRLLNSPQANDWTVLNLPALAELNDPLGRNVGEALWPERYDEKFYEGLRKGRERSFASMYQQRPTAMEGSMFKRSWFNRRWDILPIHDFSEDGVRRASRWKVVQFVDTAFKTGVGSDYSVIATWATDGVDFYVLDVWRKQVEYPDLKRAIVNSATAHKPRAIFIEDKASGQSILQDLRVNTALPIVPFTVGGSKEGRADAVTPFFEAGKVVLPSSASWVDEFIEEHISFPNAAHDDMVDTTSMALRELALRGQQTHEPLQLVIGQDKKTKKSSPDSHWSMLRTR